jgi:hypothetical protein
MKLIVLMIAVLLAAGLSGCKQAINQFDAADYRVSETLFSTICLDGVEYWIRGASSKSYMAVRIDPASLKPKICSQYK